MIDHPTKQIVWKSIIRNNRFKLVIQGLNYFNTNIFNEIYILLIINVRLKRC